MIKIHQRHRQTDRQTTCDRNTALCTKVYRAVKTQPPLFSLLNNNFVDTSHRCYIFKILGGEKFFNDSRNQIIMHAALSRRSHKALPSVHLSVCLSVCLCSVPSIYLKSESRMETSNLVKI